MVRIVKEHAVRRNEILDAAQRRVQTEGYERMAIQDILDDLRIAKGTFYHYFDSKQALLEALIARMLNQVDELLAPIVHDARLSALEKLDGVFSTLGRWKTARKPFFLELLRVWYTDENAIVRDKVRTANIERIGPLLTLILRQGVREGVFTTAFPDELSRALLALLYDLSDTLAAQLLAFDPAGGDLRPVERTVAAYTDALERMLGAPSHSLCLADSDTLRQWFLSTADHAPVGQPATGQP